MAIIREITKSVLATLMVLAAVEVTIRGVYFVRNSFVHIIPLPYNMGGDYGPKPPWETQYGLITQDPVLVWRNRSDIERTYVDFFGPRQSEQETKRLRHRFFPGVPDSLKGNAVWKVSTNSEGFRGADFSAAKDPRAFRIICLGDSWTFGTNVDQHDTFPHRLEALLRADFPMADFEVLNLGVPGYATYNGLELLKSRALELEADFFVLGFAMNEPKMAGYRKDDEENENGDERRTLSRFFSGIETHASETIELYRLLKYWALLIKWEPKSFGESLKGMVDARQWYDGEWEHKEPEPWLKVSFEDYEKHLLEMIDLARRKGAGAALLFPDFWRQSPYRRGMQRISRATGIPLVDGSALLGKARRRIELELEERLDLRTSATHGSPAVGVDADHVEVVFRVYMESQSVPEAVYITGASPALGDLMPNKVAMYDDGSHGDQKAGDRVWSHAAILRQGEVVYYTYTNSGSRGVWENLDVPMPRRFRADGVGGRIYAPIDTFGRAYMHADAWHTNVAGNDLIVKALLGVLKKDEQVKTYIRRMKP
jgi:lysophospholipase L1-like esterase